MEFTNEKAFEINKETWNNRVIPHVESDFYNVASFKKGTSSLKQFELTALANVKNASLLHLQCHFGLDTLSWAREGAVCTGIDISETAIAYAKKLGAELNLQANFVCCNVLDTSKYIQTTFDIVFTSYGTIGWLPHLTPWAQMIAERLKPGGYFYLVDFHPIAWMFDYTVAPPVMRYGYQQKTAIYEEYKGSYAVPDGNFTSKEYGWNHGIGEIINALIKAGLSIDYVNEHEQSPYNVFPNLVANSCGMFELPSKQYPLIFEIKATKI